MYEVKAIIRPEMLDSVIRRLHSIERLPGVTTFPVHGYGRRALDSSTNEEYGEVRMVQCELVVPKDFVEPVLQAINSAAGTGRPGDGKIFVTGVDRAAKIGSGKVDAEAL